MLRREELIEKLLDGKPAQGGRPPARERSGAARGRSRGRAGSARRDAVASAPREIARLEIAHRGNVLRKRLRSPRPRSPSRPHPRRSPPFLLLPLDPIGHAANAAAASAARARASASTTCCCRPPAARRSYTARAALPARLCCARWQVELSGVSNGPDPIALLIDPSPEELADWRREAPDAEIVAAGKDRHASDALAQAKRRAESGEDVILLVDSLSRLEDPEAAKEIFDAGLGTSRKRFPRP